MNKSIYIKYKDFEKNIDTPINITFGDLVEKLLSICNLLIYDVEKMNIVLKNCNEITIGELEVMMETNLESINFEEVNCIQIIPRDITNKDNEFINRYNNYIITREDERIAQNIQNQYNYGFGEYQMPQSFLNLLNQNMNTDNNQSYTFTLPLTFLNSFTQNFTRERDNNSNEVESNEDNSNEDNSDENISEEDNRDEEELPQIENDQELASLNTYLNRMTNLLQTFQDLINSENNQQLRENNTIQPPLFPNINQENIEIENTRSTPLGTHPISLNNPQQFLDLIRRMVGNDDDMEDVKIVSTKDEIDTFKVMTYLELKNTKFLKMEQCNICLEDYLDQDELMVLNCEHYFHKNCIVPWLGENSNKCPICKARVSKGKAINL